MFKVWKFNILGKDSTRPRIYHVDCGVSPGTEYPEFKECIYYKKK